MFMIFKQFSYLRLNILEVLEKEKNKEQITLYMRIKQQIG